MPPMRGLGARLRRILWRLGLALLPAVLFGLYSRRPAVAFVGYIVLVPWIVLYTDRRGGRVPLVYYVIGVCLSWIALHPAAARLGWYAPVLAGALATVWWVPFGLGLRAAHRRWELPRTLTVPVLWVACEWLRLAFTVGHFDLYGLGYTQARFPALIQVADLTGAYGVSFLVAAVNGLLADIVFAIRDREGSVRAALRSRRVVRCASGVLAAFLAVLLYGAFRLASAREEEGPTLAIVQPNVRHTLRNLVGVHLTQVLLTERKVPEGAADLIVWPENAVFEDLRWDGAYLEDLAWLGDRKGALVLVGAFERSEALPGKSMNVAALVDGEGRILGQYRKQLLFPWTEYLPFDDLLARVSPALHRIHRLLVRRGWGYLVIGVPADHAELLRLPWRGGELPFGVAMCHEHIYPPIVAETARLGARFIVNPTSEGETEGPAQEQMLRISILRAVENRVPYARCGNTGISGIVDAQGRVRSVLRGERGGTIMEAGVLIDEVPLSPGGPTLYARSRDAFAKGCVLLSVGLLLPLGRAGWRRRGSAGLLAVSVLGLGGCGTPSALGEDPARASEALEAGRRLYDQGLHREARPYLEIACSAAQACERALPLLADGYQNSQDLEDGALFFRRVALRHPSLAGEAKGYEAFMLQMAGYVLEAATTFEEALRLAPSARTWVLLGKLRLRQLDDPARALEAFRRALEMDPGDSEARYMAGRSQWFLGDIEGARRTVEEAVARAPRSGEAWSFLGRVRLRLGDEPGAEEALLRAAGLDPSLIEARCHLVRIAFRRGRLDEADRWLREILAIEGGLGRGPRE